MRKTVTVLRDVVNVVVGERTSREEIGALFRTARETAGLTMGVVSRRVGCDVTVIADYEAGRAQPASWKRLFMHLEPVSKSTSVCPDEANATALFTVLVMKLGRDVEITSDDLRKAVVGRARLNRITDSWTGSIKYRVTLDS